MFQEVGEYYYPGMAGDVIFAVQDDIEKYVAEHDKLCRPKRYFVFNDDCFFRADMWYRYVCDTQFNITYCILCIDSNRVLWGEIRLNEEEFHKYFVTRESLLGF